MKVLTSLLLLALSAEPTASVDEAPSVDLQIDMGALPDDELTQGLKSFLRERQIEVVEDAGLEVRAGAPWEIRIRVSRYGDGDVHSRAVLVLVDTGDGTPREERTVECELCTDGELVSKIGVEVSQLSARALEEPSEVAEALPEAPPPAPKPVDEPEAEPPEVEEGRRIGRMSYTGIGAIVAGVAGAASGVPLLLRRDELRLMPEGTVQIRSTYSASLLMISIGGTLIATGAVLISVDKAMRRRQREIYVQPGPTPLGLAMKARF